MHTLSTFDYSIHILLSLSRLTTFHTIFLSFSYATNEFEFCNHNMLLDLDDEAGWPDPRHTTTTRYVTSHMKIILKTKFSLALYPYDDF